MCPTEASGREDAVKGFANEHIAVGILMRRYQNVSLVDLPLSTYDIIIVRKTSDGQEDIIRAQVKTATKNIKFTGGIRGGKDRTYKSNVKKYRQNTKTSDVVIGVYEEKEQTSNDNHESYSLFFIPTRLIEILDQDSVTLNRVASLKNNYDALEHCKDYDWVQQFADKNKLTRKKNKNKRNT